MQERLNFLIVYLGSAATAAFLAACLTSPRLAMAECGSGGAHGAEGCDFAASLAVVAAKGKETNPENVSTDEVIWKSVAMAAQD